MNHDATPEFSPDSSLLLPRRQFIKSALAGAGALSMGPLLAPQLRAQKPGRPDYDGPNVVIVRFGGGVRRRETIDTRHTYAPYLAKELVKQGVLYPNMEINQFEDVDTSHGQGTLYILTGKYDKFKDIEGKFLGSRFEAKVPTVFEYLRNAYNVPEYQTLIINGEDRTDEEFYSFSNHHLFGAGFKSSVLSLYRYKTYLLQQQIAEGVWEGAEREKKVKELAKMEALDYRTDGGGQSPEIQRFWERWRGFYGESGFVNPRGDRLLTTLALRAMEQLQPRLMMINYNDPDYVHWGYMSHYTRGVAVIDEGLRRLVTAVEKSEFYRDNTVFVVVPDCGRDSNPMQAVPCQHHFNSKSAHQIWSLVFGPGIDRGRIVTGKTDQSSVAGTIGKIMGFETEFAENQILGEVFA